MHDGIGHMVHPQMESTSPLDGDPPDGEPPQMENPPDGEPPWMENHTPRPDGEPPG